jgi:hypothetical protein
VAGYVLAEVETCQRIINGNVPAEYLKYAGWDPSTTESKNIVPDKLWRTLVADRAPDEKFSPRWYKRACQYCLNDDTIMSRNNDLNTQAKSGSPVIRQFLKRMRAVVWNRQLFIAGDNDKYFGLMPEEGRAGDLVCILEGCTVPVILHPMHTQPDGTYFEFIGEAFVYGAMDGEEVPPKEDQEGLRRWFSLV